jgi:hypothetical protein
MKNLKIKIIVFIALGGLIISCKKNGEQKLVFFPETFFFTHLTKQNEVRLFTKGREIKDADTIARFIQNNPNFNLPDQPVNGLQSIVLNSKSLAKIGTQQYNLNSDFALTKTDFIFYSSPYSVNPNDLIFRISKYSQPLKSTGTAPNLTYTTQEVRVAHGSYLNLNFSYLSYKIKQGVGVNQTIQTGIKFNEAVDFKTAFLSQLNTTDTIAVQEFIGNYAVK